MASPETLGETALCIRRTFPAARERVFRAWTDPEELKRWSAPADDYTIPTVEVDLRVGGRYRIEMRNPEGELHIAHGVYREVRPPERLVYSWAWETDPDRGHTQVTVDFLARGDATEVVLTHERFPDPPMRDRHLQGWTGCFDRLGRRLAAKA